jgi:hypothetical protein
MLVKPPKILYKLGLSRLKGVHERYQTFDLILQKELCIMAVHIRGWKGEAWRRLATHHGCKLFMFLISINLAISIHLYYSFFLACVYLYYLDTLGSSGREFVYHFCRFIFMFEVWI